MLARHPIVAPRAPAAQVNRRCVGRRDGLAGMRPHFIASAAAMLLAACDPRPAAPSGQPHAEEDQAKAFNRTSDTEPAPGRRDTTPATARITITGPTLVVAVRRPAADDTSHEGAEASDDRSFYAGRAADFLEARGVRSVFFAADTLHIEQDGKEVFVAVQEGEPLCYFTTPGHQPLSFYGFDSDADIIDAAATYFWGGEVPHGQRDTLTPQGVTVDFVVTRPTVIAFFSRRALNVSSAAPPVYPDSARLVEQVASLRNSLDSSGVTLELTFKDRFTVLLRGAIDTVIPIRSGTAIGYYAASPRDWQTQIMGGFWPTPKLAGEIKTYLNRANRTGTSH